MDPEIDNLHSRYYLVVRKIVAKNQNRKILGKLIEKSSKICGSDKNWEISLIEKMLTVMIQ